MTKSNVLTAVLAIVVTPFLLGFAIMPTMDLSYKALVYCFSYFFGPEMVAQTRFKSSAWRKHKEQRLSMYEDLLVSERLDHATRIEVLQLLGPPDEYSVSLESDSPGFCYEMKTGHRGYFEAKLQVFFRKGRVCKVQTYFDV